MVFLGVGGSAKDVEPPGLRGGTASEVSGATLPHRAPCEMLLSCLFARLCGANEESIPFAAPRGGRCAIKQPVCDRMC